MFTPNSIYKLMWFSGIFVAVKLKFDNEDLKRKITYAKYRESYLRKELGGDFYCLCGCNECTECGI